MQYILVHGAWQGGWCWEALARLLRKMGHHVSCPDLPGHGANACSLDEVTYKNYYQFLERELSRYKEPVVLVAHSMAALFAAPLFDKYSEKIAHLFIIAGFVAQNGQSLLDIAQAGGPSKIPDIMSYDPKNNTQSVDLKQAKEALYFDCPDAVADWAIHKLQPQPMAIFMTPIHWVDSGKTRSKRTYILCENDRDVHPITQRNVLKTYPCHTVSIQSGHFPFLSQPEELAKIITRGIHADTIL